MSKNPLHSKESPEWGTPIDYIEAARLTMGGIDLDPASSEEFNKTVQAVRYFDKESNGLEQSWAGNVFINSPGGLVNEFWQKLISEFLDDNINQAIWVGYSLQQLQTLQRVEITPLDYSLCFPRKRISFVKPGEVKNSPTHANYICHLHRKTRNPSLFKKHFFQFGHVIVQ